MDDVSTSNGSHENFDGIASPSDVSKHPRQQSKIFGEDPLVGLLLQGFNIALATLQHRLNDLEKVDVHSGEVKFTADYPGFAVKYYSTEDDREKAIKTSFIDPMGGEGMWKKTIWYAGEIKPDCSWWSND